MSQFKTISPIDGSVYLERSYADAQQMDKALTAAKHVQKEWQNTSLEQRAACCHKAMAYFLQHEEEIAMELTWQMGRPLKYTPFEISGGLQERSKYMIDIASTALAAIQIPEAPTLNRYIKRVPLGTLLVLAPWNYPYLTSVNAIIPALMAGNTVILKHADQTPLCAERYAAAFDAAGLPKGVFQYLHMNHDQVADLIKDPRINYVAFTGSVKGGTAVQQAMSGRILNGGFELGGKDPAYVRSDANLAHAIENLVDGSFFNSGQSCCGIERIYVHRNLYKDFVDGFVALTKKYQLGNPLEMTTNLGPMVRSRAAVFAKQQIDQAVAAGAQTLIDPKHFPAHEEGTPYMAPQVLVDVDHQMSIMQEESFAPLVGIMPVDSDEAAIQLMNDSAYGLTAAIWTSDQDAATNIGRQLETGTVFMNRCDYLDPALAWTGVKNSGRGCTLSSLGYESLTRPQSFHFRTLS